MTDSSPGTLACPAKLRRAEPREAGMLTALALRSKAYWGYDERFMEACVAELTVSEEMVREWPTFVVETDHVVGFYMLSSVEQGEVELEMLFVEPAAIGRGYGKKLLDHAKDIARSFGYRSILVQGDPNADGFYRSQGAERIGERASASIRGRMLPVYRIAL